MVETPDKEFWNADRKKLCETQQNILKVSNEIRNTVHDKNEKKIKSNEIQNVE